MEFGVDEGDWDADDFSKKLHDDLFGKRTTCSLPAAGGGHAKMNRTRRKSFEMLNKRDHVRKSRKIERKHKCQKNTGASEFPAENSVSSISTPGHVTMPRPGSFKGKKNLGKRRKLEAVLPNCVQVKPEDFKCATGDASFKRKRKPNKRNKYRHLLQRDDGAVEHPSFNAPSGKSAAWQSKRIETTEENFPRLQTPAESERLLDHGVEREYKAIPKVAVTRLSKKLKKKHNAVSKATELKRLKLKYDAHSEETAPKSKKCKRKHKETQGDFQSKIPGQKSLTLGKKNEQTNWNKNLHVAACQLDSGNLKKEGNTESFSLNEGASDAKSLLRKQKKYITSVGSPCLLDIDKVRNLLSHENVIVDEAAQFDKETECLTADFPRKLPTDRSAIIHQRAMGRLRAAQFRFLNEQLYAVTGKEALKLFDRDSATFRVYHEGYQLQVAKWPVNPVDVIIQDLQDRDASLVIADFGCGEAKISQHFPNRKTYAFDLVALNENVTECDMCQVPLDGESIDIAIYCLSLMGTNLSDYICEGHRVLRMGGIMKIAEVESRFGNVDAFIEKVEKHGFKLLNKDSSYKYFLLMDFEKDKTSVKKAKLPALQLQPCLYKKR